MKPTRNLLSFPSLQKSSTVFVGMAALLLSYSVQAQTTGFSQAAGGTYDYNTSGNWVGGNINGVWDSSLTLAGGQTATFGTDTTASTGLDFRYDGAQNVTLRSDGTGPYTLTLGGNINLATVSLNRSITIGSTTANQGLNMDLGGATRTFSVGGIAATSSTRFLDILNNVTNGGLILNGGGQVTLNGNTNTLTSLRIQNSALRFNGNGGTDVSTTVSGALTIDGAANSIAGNTTHLGGIATITLTPNANHNTSLSASSLVRENKGVVFIRGNNLGGTLGANGVSNVTFTSAPTLIGGIGAAGTKNISIMNWAVGATGATANANTFLTYDSANGVRALNTTSEFENYAASYSGAVTGTDLNTRIATGAVTFTGNNTVNSLFIGESGTSTLAGDGGTLTVTSGAVFLQGSNSAISQNLNFGTREGIIGYIQGQNTTISGGIAGSGGLTAYQANSNTSTFGSGSGLTFSGEATFTGDFTVNSRVAISHSEFLAHGARTGNTVVNGSLNFTNSGTLGAGYSMNGLYGNGRIMKENSGAATIRIGENNAGGNFTGTISQNGVTTVQKLGSGTQIFSGANAYSITQILGGTLETSLLANGGVNSGIGFGTNAAANLVINGGTLKYTGAAISTDRLFQVGQTTTGATATLDASGTGAVDFNNAGALAFGTVGSTSTAQTRSLTLTGTNNGANTLAAVIGNNGGAVNGNSDVSVTKDGDGTWILLGANTYKGATTVNEGTLIINGNSSVATGALTVAAGATLGGGGIAGGATTINGIVAPGNSIGTLTVNNDVTWNSNDAWVFELGSAASSLALADSGASIQDLLNITGVGSDFIKGTGSLFTFNFANTGEVGYYKIVDWTGTTGFVAEDFAAINLAPGTTGLFTVDAGTSALYLNVVPEPDVAMLTGGLGLLALLRRRRSK